MSDPKKNGALCDAYAAGFRDAGGLRSEQAAAMRELRQLVGLLLERFGCQVSLDRRDVDAMPDFTFEIIDDTDNRQIIYRAKRKA